MHVIAAFIELNTTIVSYDEVLWEKFKLAFVKYLNDNVYHMIQYDENNRRILFSQK